MSVRRARILLAAGVSASLLAGLSAASSSVATTLDTIADTSAAPMDAVEPDASTAATVEAPPARCPNPEGGSQNHCVGPLDPAEYTTTNAHVLSAGGLVEHGGPGRELPVAAGQHARRRERRHERLSGGLHVRRAPPGHCNGQPSTTVPNTFLRRPRRVPHLERGDRSVEPARRLRRRAVRRGHGPGDARVDGRRLPRRRMGRHLRRHRPVQPCALDHPEPARPRLSAAPRQWGARHRACRRHPGRQRHPRRTRRPRNWSFRRSPSRHPAFQGRLARHQRAQVRSPPAAGWSRSRRRSRGRSRTAPPRRRCR